MMNNILELAQKINVKSIQQHLFKVQTKLFCLTLKGASCPKQKSGKNLLKRIPYFLFANSEFAFVFQGEKVGET